MSAALVYVNHGRVIVDCPGPNSCGNAYMVPMGAASLKCEAAHSGCGFEFPLAVPDNLADILSELSRRPNKSNQNWYPEGHPVAVKGNLPMGQTPADLAAEFEMAGV